MNDLWIPDPCNYATKWRLWYLLDRHQLTISNKEIMKPDGFKGDPEYTIAGWYKGYSFQRFWGNCYALLGDKGNLVGMQQLCHQYYLQNGSLGAKETVIAIKRFLGFSI